MTKKNSISMNEINVKSENGVITHHSMIKHQDTKGLLIMLPGKNSNSDRLMMHSVGSKMIDNGYDVLNINYSGILGDDSEIEGNFNKLLELSKDVTNDQLPGYDGKKILMFCRDIGSAVGIKLAECLSTQVSRTAIVSPVSGDVSNKEGLDCKVYLDSENQLMSFEGITNFAGNPRTELKLCPNVGNNFEFNNDPGLKLNMMKEVVSDIVAYLDN